MMNPPRNSLYTFLFCTLFGLSSFCLKAEENSKKGSNPPLMIETVNVDDAENKPDHNGHGSVNHHFKIGKFDVTAREWCVFLNAVATKGFPADPFHLFNTKMQIDSFVSCIKKVTSPGGTISYKVISKKDGDKEAAGDEDSLDRGQLPITYIDFFAAVRFCNWLSHGQPDSGEENKTTTEDGPYTINGTLCHANFSENQESYDQSKWPGGFWRLPSDDEWYKAAYYDKANSDHEGQYWLYSTSEGNQPFNSIEEVYNQPIATEGAFQNVNYHLIYTDHTTGQLVDRFTKENLPFITPVGIFKYSPGPFGTYDMGGNVAQWTDSRSFVRKSDDSLVTMETTMIRGGSWKSTSPREISSENYVFIDQKSNDPQEHGSQGLSLLQYASNDVGFRVVCIQLDPVTYNTATTRIWDQYKKDWHAYCQNYYTNPQESSNIRIDYAIAGGSAYETSHCIELAGGACDFLLSLLKAGITTLSPEMIRNIFDNIPGWTIPPLEDYWKTLQGTLRDKYEGIALERALQQASRDAKKRLFFDLVNKACETHNLTDDQIKDLTKTVYGTESLEEAADIAVQRSEGFVSAQSTAVISSEAAKAQVAADGFWAKEFANIAPVVEDAAHIASAGIMLIPEGICYTYAAPVASALFLTYLTYIYLSSGSVENTKYGFADTVATGAVLVPLVYDMATCIFPELKVIKYSIPYLRYLL